jgi:hypothetical protein
MEVLGFRMSRGGGGSQTVSMMVASFTRCAPCATRQAALRGLVLAPAIFALYGWSAAAQTTTTYTYTGNPFTVAACEMQGIPVSDCLAGNLTATVTIQGLPPAPVQNPLGSQFITIPISSFSITGAGLTVTSATAASSCLFDIIPYLAFYENRPSGGQWVLYDWYVAGCTTTFGYLVTQNSPSADLVETNYFTGYPGGVSYNPGKWTVSSIQTGTPSLQIIDANLPSAQDGQPYPPTTTPNAGIITADGGGGGYTWCVQSGSQCVLAGSPLPPGFELAPEISCGNICTKITLSSIGNAEAPPGSYPFTIQVSDSAGNLATQAVTLTVSCPMQVTPSARGTSVSSPTGAAMYAEAYSSTGLTLVNAAKACNFISFAWQQEMWNLPCPSGMFPVVPSNIPAQNLCPASMGVQAGSITATAANPLLDPVNGGDTNNEPGFIPCVNCYPFFGSPLTTVESAENSPGAICSKNTGICLVTADNKLTFYDVPVGALFASTPASSNPPVNSYKGFNTTLVGVSTQASQEGVPCDPSGGSTAYYCTTLYSWAWNSTFNGSAGGITFLDDDGIGQYPPDPGSGTGGVTITGINGVQLPTAVSPSQVATTASGLAYSRVSQTFNGTVTLRNISGGAISGPFQILFFGMPANVTLVNATSNLSGTPYLTVPGVATLPPGQSATVSVQFKNPSNSTINLTPVIYSGSIN